MLNVQSILMLIGIGLIGNDLNTYALLNKIEVVYSLHLFTSRHTNPNP